MRKMSILYKISYSALFIALGVILSRFVSIPGLFGLPFLKVSPANSIVMFSSFYLGPFFGFLVGTFVDTLGALLFPTGPYNPLFTIAASLTGLMPYICYAALKKIKIEEKVPIISIILIVALNLFLMFFFIFNDVIYSESGKTTYELYPWLKWTISSVCLVLSIIFFVALSFLNKKYKNKKFSRNYSINLIASSVFLTYFIFKIPVGSAVQAFVLDWDFWIILTARLLTGFVTSFVHIFLISIALDVSLNFNIEGALLTKSGFFSRIKKNYIDKKSEQEETYGKE